MSFDPDYGETPLPFDELDEILPAARESLAEPITKAVVYDLEQLVESKVADELLVAAFDGELKIDELLTDHFLRELHHRL